MGFWGMRRAKGQRRDGAFGPGLQAGGPTRIQGQRRLYFGAAAADAYPLRKSFLLCFQSPRVPELGLDTGQNRGCNRGHRLCRAALGSTQGKDLGLSFAIGSHTLTSPVSTCSLQTPWPNGCPASRHTPARTVPAPATCLRRSSCEDKPGSPASAQRHPPGTR